MNRGRSLQSIPLSGDFIGYGNIDVDLNTFCCFTRGAGWLDGSTTPRRWYKGAFGNGSMVFACEAVARSLMAYDHKHYATDPLVVSMVDQYKALYQNADDGLTLTLMEQMFKDKSLHVRALRPCPSRGKECHNPFHRLLHPKRTNINQQYRRYVKARAANPAIVTDPFAALHLRMPRALFQQLQDRFETEMSKAREEYGADFFKI